MKAIGRHIISTLTLIALTASNSMAQYFRAGNLLYRLVDGGAEVVYNGDRYLNDNPLVIPAEVQHESVTYPVVGIGKRALKASDYKSLQLPETLKYIDDEAFYGCDFRVELPEGLEYLGRDAFCGYYGHQNANPAIAPSSIKVVGDQTVRYSRGVWEVYARVVFKGDDLPAGLEELGASVYDSSPFFEWDKPFDKPFPPTLRKLGKKCFRDNNFSSIDLSGGAITHLPECLIEKCRRLRTVIIGESVKYIDFFTGYDYDCEIWALPPGLRDYHGIHSAKFFAYPMEPPKPYGELALGLYGDKLQGFDPESCVLHVPKGTAEAYRNAVGWKAFENIVDDLPVSKLTVIEDDADEPSFRIEERRVIADGIIEVYALDGRLIASGTKDELTPLTPGLYVLRIDGCSAKAVVR